MTADDVGSPTTPARPVELAEALRTAIERSGLGLARLRHHLAQRGLHISTATLSHWQTGRSVPERAASLRVVDGLEEVLGLAPGELRSLVPAPRPRGRGAEVTLTEPVHRMASHWERLSNAVATLSLSMDDSVRLVSSHQVLELGADRLPVSDRVRHVVRAAVDLVDRVPAYYCDESPHPTLPRIHPRIGCLPGRSAHDAEIGMTVVELVLPAPLRSGERTLIEYDIEHVPIAPTSAELTVTHPLREAAVVVRFHPDALPVEVAAQVEEEDAVSRTRVHPDVAGVVSLVRHDVRRGSVGLHWTWPEDDRA